MTKENNNLIYNCFFLFRCPRTCKHNLHSQLTREDSVSFRELFTNEIPRSTRTIRQTAVKIKLTSISQPSCHNQDLLSIHSWRQSSICRFGSSCTGHAIDILQQFIESYFIVSPRRPIIILYYKQWDFCFQSSILQYFYVNVFFCILYFAMLLKDYFWLVPVVFLLWLFFFKIIFFYILMNYCKYFHKILLNV